MAKPKLSIVPAAPALNAVKHGILSRYTVLPGEQAADYQALIAALVHEHRPDGPTEAFLIEQIAGAVWRMTRVRRAEAAVSRKVSEDTDTPEDALVEALDQPIAQHLPRYETHLTRMFERSLATLFKVQEMRAERDLKPRPANASEPDQQPAALAG